MDNVTEQLIERGRAAYDRRDYLAGLTAFRQVLERHPDFADIRHLNGLCLSFLGQPEAALAEFDRAVALNDRYVEAHLNRAITLNELGRFEDARAAFARAGQVETEAQGRFPALVAARLANAHAGVGDLYMEAGAADEAANQYRLALELRPRFHDIRNKLGEALLSLGDVEGALEELQRAVTGNPRFIEARLNVGLAHYRGGNAEAAAEAWRECHSMQPGHPQTRAYMAMLERHGVAAPAPPAASG